MGICKKKIFFFIILNLFLIFVSISFSYSEVTFKKLENKKVSYIDFFLVKFESQLIRRAQVLGKQFFATRVQYSNIGIKVNFDNKKKQVFIDIYAIMDRNRYSKKKYVQKITDCNQVRNLLFYKNLGYKFLTQKRDPSLSTGIMEDIFKEDFFNNLSFENKEKDFLADNMFVKVTIFHPIKKQELTCSGKVNDYELK